MDEKEFENLPEESKRRLSQILGEDVPDVPVEKLEPVETNYYEENKEVSKGPSLKIIILVIIVFLGILGGLAYGFLEIRKYAMDALNENIIQQINIPPSPGINDINNNEGEFFATPTATLENR